MRLPLILALALVPATALAAAPAVSLSTAVLAEQTHVVAGRQETTLAPVARALPGNRLVFRTSFRNAGTAPATRVVVVNPVPRGVVFADVSGPSAEVSIDGGRSFGQLAALRVRELDGRSRVARADDVAAVRWIIPTVAPGASGQLEYRGTVR